MDTSATVAERSVKVDEPDTRGRLILRDRAIARIATTAALEVPGVVVQRGGLTRITGRDLPRADISTGSHSVAVNLYLGVQWPCDVPELTRRVHRKVGDQVETLTGMPLHQLGVFIAGTETETAGDDDSEYPAPAPADAVAAPRPPTAAPAAVPAAVSIAVGFLALGAIAARELLISRGTLPGAPWLRNTFEWAGRQHWHHWLVFAALAALALGILLVLLALAPRTRTHMPVRADSDTPTVWLRPVDVARLCSVEAGSVAGVAGVHTTVDRRRATVHVTAQPDAPTDDLRTSVETTVGDALAPLDRKLKLRVKIRRGKSRT
ncbi:Asp23/Gls24 family envelope stress response protein [Rhodococcus spongiicola]|uniref:Asp23/Gls24 family envelope stress response protein n=1 Tax=Rhodococcus spongiicola TaxID=2487352 RepID=A0A438AT22_9NOCA|nr:Asp23/Gls24 family envelope stress response protein [Rhodococcus spongiicola]